MSPIGNSSDEIIRRAMQEGAFDNLPGKGKPLNLDENPHEPEDMRLANRLLHANGFSLPWLEMRKEIEEALEKARTDARDAWLSGDGQRWTVQVHIFEQQIEALNKQIFNHNLQAPSTQFHCQRLDLAQEIKTVQRRDSFPQTPTEAHNS